MGHTTPPQRTQPHTQPQPQPQPTTQGHTVEVNGVRGVIWKNCLGWRLHRGQHANASCPKNEELEPHPGKRRQLWWGALFHESYECAHWQNFLAGFKSSRYLDVNCAASSGWAFTYQRLLHSFPIHLRSAITWEFPYVSSAATGAFRKSRVPLPTSVVNAPSLAADVALPYLNGFAQRMWLSKTKITKNASLVKV